MTADLSILLAQNQAIVTSFFLTFLRVGATMALLPAFGEQAIPMRIRLGLSLAFTVPVYSILFAEHQAFAEIGIVEVAVEIVAGLSLGIILRSFVFALQMIGAIVAQSISLSQMFGTASSEPQPAIGHLLFWGGLSVALANGFHLLVIEAFILSYTVLPIGQLPSGENLTNLGVSHIARAFSLAFVLSSPFLAASLLYNVAIGVINRAMPQLMVAMVGAPAITLGGIVLLLLISPAIISLWWAAFSETLFNPFLKPQ
ncbi:MULTISPECIES: flagellar biosynthetic protein FliR [Halocynthiibacter]|uniref:Flagellar biosynthetic protein FliR n=1 Tax=Halocynthiibacter halioticoli TaxID=2986804 RepID=A0AAE3LU74_9RHOB|nr:MULTISPECIES: flagellar biosynthetic protein FliR [Halocynthiibacter]MCV6823080.1 flagellar biosynthetic protein FliR [Halocynthiibacter halioticoli]MCW4056081.1 flagellar biosynthetic protein FliR [Halocynthiibacter sp. SDUM655004]